MQIQTTERFVKMLLKLPKKQNVRTLVKWSSFDDGKPKGEYLKAYKSRKELALENKSQ